MPPVASAGVNAHDKWVKWAKSCENKYGQKLNWAKRYKMNSKSKLWPRIKMTWKVIVAPLTKRTTSNNCCRIKRKTKSHTLSSRSNKWAFVLFLLRESLRSFIPINLRQEAAPLCGRLPKYVWDSCCRMRSFFSACNHRYPMPPA